MAGGAAEVRAAVRGGQRKLKMIHTAGGRGKKRTNNCCVSMMMDQLRGGGGAGGAGGGVFSAHIHTDADVRRKKPDVYFHIVSLKNLTIERLDDITAKVGTEQV